MQDNAFPGREQISTPMVDSRKSGLPIPKRQNPLAPARVVYCAGDAEKLLRYDILSDRWSYLDQKNTSQYRGDLKYAAISRVSSNSLLMTGGCSTRDL
jgi:hypothetical protein